MQQTFVILIVAACALLLIRRMVRASRGKAGHCSCADGKGCRNASGCKTCQAAKTHREKTR